MEQKDKRGSNECAQSARKKQIGERGDDLCFHGNQMLPGIKVPLLDFLLKSLRGKRKTREKEFPNKMSFEGTDGCLRRLNPTTISCSSLHHRKTLSVLRQYFSHSRQYLMTFHQLLLSVEIILFFVVIQWFHAK